MDGRNKENLNLLIKKYLTKYKCNIEGRVEETWSLRKSPLGDFGIFADRDIQPGEIIFLDYPVLLGPRCLPNTVLPVQCSTCYSLLNVLKCNNNCGLLVCEQCVVSQRHSKECQLLRKLYNGCDLFEKNNQLTKCLTPLRSLLLEKDDLQVVTSLKSHRDSSNIKTFRKLTIRLIITSPACISHRNLEIDRYLGSQHGQEVQVLTEDLKLQLSREERDFLYFICTVLDANAFEVLTDPDSSQISLKGLYPLGSLANHRCFPNAFHVFDEKHRMVARASVFIPKNTEIFNTYTRLLWGTITRSFHLKTTKHFVCTCDRCEDPTEFGSYLTAINCQKCPGKLLPINPSQKSDWKCEDCTSVDSLDRVAKTLGLVGSVLKGFDADDFKLMYNFLTKKLVAMVPDCNHVVVELKYKIIWILGYKQGFFWDELPLELLLVKKQFCKDILEILGKLKLGKCKIRGLVCYELYLCNEKMNGGENRVANESFDDETDKYLREAVDILKFDCSAPSLLKNKIWQEK